MTLTDIRIAQRGLRHFRSQFRSQFPNKGEANNEAKPHEQIHFIEFPTGAKPGNRNLRLRTISDSGQGCGQGGAEIHQLHLRTVVAKEASTAGATFTARQKAIQFLKTDPQMRTVFINKVAAPIANKMFECGLIP
jgi:hypothetical protein